MKWWTSERLSEAAKELGAETTVQGGCQRVADRLSRRWQVEITTDSMHKAFRRHGMPAPTTFIGGPGNWSWSTDADERDTEPPTNPISETVPMQPCVDCGNDYAEGYCPHGKNEPVIDPVVAHVARRVQQRDKRQHQELIERLAIAEERVRFLDGISGPIPPAAVRPTPPDHGTREATAVALASDWHVEESVDSEKVEGRNQYNLDIAKRRASKFFDGVEWLVGYHRQAFTIRNVILWLGGDFLSGFIHEELAESNELSPTETILALRILLRDGIKLLLQDKKLERLIIPCNHGNHGRTTAKRRISTGAENSFEWLLYHVLASDFAEEPRVRFIIARGAHVYVDAYDWTLHFHHGDDVSYQGGVGGIAIPLNKAIAGWNTVRRADIHHIGHFHTLLHGRDFVANGSLIGYNPFAFSIKASFEPPQQAFYLLDSKKGRTMASPIWVTDESAYARHDGAA